jgi:flavin-dependent dehydrogenase
VAGTWQALLFAKAGCKVTIYERGVAWQAHVRNQIAANGRDPFGVNRTVDKAKTPS